MNWHDCIYQMPSIFPLSMGLMYKHMELLWSFWTDGSATLFSTHEKTVLHLWSNESAVLCLPNAGGFSSNLVLKKLSFHGWFANAGDVVSFVAHSVFNTCIFCSNIVASL